jgi:hypothetical protein
LQLANLTKQYKPVAMFAGHDHVVSYMWDDNFDTAFFISGAGSFSGGCMKTFEAIFRLSFKRHTMFAAMSDGPACMHWQVLAQGPGRLQMCKNKLVFK